MTIKYCDFINGNDTTGDGTYGLPYKTIDKASTSLVGGDEVRVAKSPDNITLTGTWSFTNNSTAVTGTGTTATTQLALGDFIVAPDTSICEIVTITENTSIVLGAVYAGSSQSGATCQKLGLTSTGAAAASTTAIQTVSGNGTNITSVLAISGGWNLSTQTQTGQSYFQQLHGTFANKYGNGLTISGKNNVQVDRLHFLRYNIGLNLTSGRTHFINSSICNGNANGILCTTGGSILTTCICCGNTTYGLQANTSCAQVISPITNSNGRGLVFINGYYTKTTNATSLLNSTCDIFIDSGQANLIYKIGCSTLLQNQCRLQTEDPTLYVQDFNNTVGDNRMYYEYGLATADGTNGVKIDPSSATYYCSIPFYFKADSGVGKTLAFQTKKDTDCNGDMQAAVYFMGVKIVDWADVTPAGTAGFENKSVAVASNLVTEDGVLELRVKARGTAGLCWVNNFSVS